MALNAQFSNSFVNSVANAAAALFNLATINIYTGTQPVNANTALSGNTLLATLTFNATAFPAAVNGVLTANAITQGTAVAGGTAAWARIVKSDGTTVLMDCTAGTASTNIIIASTTISAGGVVSASAFTLTANEQGV